MKWRYIYHFKEPPVFTRLLQSSINLTFQHNFPKYRRVPIESAAVPAMEPELALAFLDAHLGPLPETDHHPRVHPTEAALATGESRNVITQHPRANGMERQLTDKPKTIIAIRNQYTNTLYGQSIHSNHWLINLHG